MKQLILMTGLMMISLQAKLCAQSSTERLMSMSKTEQTFNNPLNFVGMRDFVVLKEGKMIIEVAQAEDYKDLGKMDSILRDFIKDIAFYKDSLAADPTAHYRIDYAINELYSFKKIRFKKYKADGDIFMNRDGEIAKLKFEQDTVNIIIQKTMPGLAEGGDAPCMVNYNARVVFILANYTDINKIVTTKELGHIIDTLATVSKPQKNRRYMLLHPTTVVYNPYFGSGSLHKYKRLMSSEWSPRSTSDILTLNLQIGASLLRNTLAPMTDAGIQLNTGYWNDYKNYTLLRLSVSGYYFFEKDIAGKYLVNDNWFINFSVGNRQEKPMEGWVGRQAVFGVGYLASPKGGYFKNTTFRLFSDVLVARGITITPELIFTNDFKQIFPGITVKVL